MASKNAPAAHKKHLAVLIDTDNVMTSIVIELAIMINIYGD